MSTTRVDPPQQPPDFRPEDRRHELARVLRRKRRLRAGTVQLLGVAAAFALAFLTPHIHVGFDIPTTRAIEMLIAVGAGTVTFIGIVFSLLFLALPAAGRVRPCSSKNAYWVNRTRRPCWPAGGPSTASRPPCRSQPLLRNATEEALVPLLLDEAGATEHGQDTADEQEQACEHHWPASLQPRSALLEPRVRALSGNEEDHDDRQRWQHERRVLEGHQTNLLRHACARGHDRRDNREIGQGGRQFDRCDRRSREQRGATTTAAAHRKLAARQAPPPPPKSDRDEQEDHARDKLDHMPDGSLRMRDQPSNSLPGPIVSTSPTAKFTLNTVTTYEWHGALSAPARGNDYDHTTRRHTRALAMRPLLARKLPPNRRSRKLRIQPAERIAATGWLDDAGRSRSLQRARTAAVPG
jgi:hypothetical protein